MTIEIDAYSLSLYENDESSVDATLRTLILYALDDLAKQRINEFRNCRNGLDILYSIVAEKYNALTRGGK